MLGRVGDPWLERLEHFRIAVGYFFVFFHIFFPVQQLAGVVTLNDIPDESRVHRRLPLYPPDPFYPPVHAFVYVCGFGKFVFGRLEVLLRRLTSRATVACTRRTTLALMGSGASGRWSARVWLKWSR